MKHLLLATLIATSFSSLANANNGIYTSLKSSIVETKYKNSQYEYIEREELYLANNQKYKKSAIAVAVGYDFSSISPVDIRLELEYMDKGKTTHNPDFNTLIDLVDVWEYNLPSWFTNELNIESLMLNGYYDFKNKSKFTPYLSAGVGVTRIKNKITDIDTNVTDKDSDNQFSWSAGVGLAYAVSESFSLDLSYRYVDSGKFNFETNFSSNPMNPMHSDIKLISNEYLLGARYTF